MIYHAFELTTMDNYDLEVDANPQVIVDLLKRDMTFNADNDIPVLELIVGKVEASDVGDALHQIRRGNWLEKETR